MSSAGGGPRYWALPTWLVTPLRELAGLYQEYGSIPRAVIAIIATYIVSSVFGLASFVVGSIVNVFDVVAGSLGFVQLRAGLTGRVIGIRLLGALADVQRAFGSAIAELGPLGPPVAAALGAVAIFALYRVGIAILGELPVGSSIVDILGLR